MKNNLIGLRASEGDNKVREICRDRCGDACRGICKEIGSEFWDVPTCEKHEKQNGLFPETTQWYLSGRSALQAIIKDIISNIIIREKNTNFRLSVAMPSWCCESMIKPFILAGIDVHFYPVYWQDRLIKKISLDALDALDALDTDMLFLMDYFGYTSTQPDLSAYKGIIIRDVTHSIFSVKYSDADYYFGSLRKWCGIWTGGFAWTRDGHSLFAGEERDGASYYIELRKKAMEMKRSYINTVGADDNNNNKNYLKIYAQAEKCLDNTVDIFPATERDVLLAEKLDVDGIKSKRRTNAEVLINGLPHEWLLFPEIKDVDCPMFVPILVPDGKRNELRQELIENKIYCPVHWPVSEYHRLSGRNMKGLYDNEISLVCDQRYGEEDMGRMIETIKR